MANSELKNHKINVNAFATDFPNPENLYFIGSLEGGWTMLHGREYKLYKYYTLDAKLAISLVKDKWAIWQKEAVSYHGDDIAYYLLLKVRY